MNIIYSDRDLAVIIKPVGMDSEHQVPAAITEKLGGEVVPIHRLDLNVGGVMVYARTKQAAAQLSKLVQEGQLVKEYRCLVHGVPPEGGVLEDFLFKDSRKNKVFVVIWLPPLGFFDIIQRILVCCKRNERIFGHFMAFVI